MWNAVIRAAQLTMQQYLSTFPCHLGNTDATCPNDNATIHFHMPLSFGQQCQFVAGLDVLQHDCTEKWRMILYSFDTVGQTAGNATTLPHFSVIRTAQLTMQQHLFTFPCHLGSTADNSTILATFPYHLGSSADNATPPFHISLSLRQHS